MDNIRWFGKSFVFLAFRKKSFDIRLGVYILCSNVQRPS